MPDSPSPQLTASAAAAPAALTVRQRRARMEAQGWQLAFLQMVVAREQAGARPSRGLLRAVARIVDRIEAEWLEDLKALRPQTPAPSGPGKPLSYTGATCDSGALAP